MNPESHPRQLTRNKNLLPLLVFSLVACSSTPEKKEIPQEKSLVPMAVQLFSPQILSADIFVEREVHGYRTKGDITIISPSALRLDLRTSLDLPLASIVMSESKIQYVLYRDKKFFTGKPGPHALDPIFPLIVDSSTLINILLEKKNPMDQCEMADGFLLGCKGNSGQMEYTVDWDKRKTTGPLTGRASKVLLKLPAKQALVKFYFNDLQTNVPNAERFLNLEVPDGFKSFSVPER